MPPLNKSYSINEFSKLVGLSAHTLRYYEKMGIMPPVQRNWTGHREYNRMDVDWANFIKCLKSTGMPIDRIREYVEMDEEDPQTLPKRRQMLEHQLDHVRDSIAQYQHYCEVLEYKLTFFGEIAAHTPRHKAQ